MDRERGPWHGLAGIFFTPHTGQEAWSKPQCLVLSMYRETASARLSSRYQNGGQDSLGKKAPTRAAGSFFPSQRPGSAAGPRNPIGRASTVPRAEAEPAAGCPKRRSCAAESRTVGFLTVQIRMRPPFWIGRMTREARSLASTASMGQGIAPAIKGPQRVCPVLQLVGLANEPLTPCGRPPLSWVETPVSASLCHIDQVPNKRR